MKAKHSISTIKHYQKTQYSDNNPLYLKIMQKLFRSIHNQFVVVILFFTTMLFFACHKEKVKDNIRLIPSAVELVFPNENSECNVGTDSTDTESTVLFEWLESKNAAFYEINIRNLITQEKISDTVSELTIPLVLKRATPYEWYVIAISASKEDSTKSKLWRFYNAGLPLESHIPFPAEIISPKMSAQITTADSSITLSWRGSDIDNDITSYDVYFGTKNPPPLYRANISDSILSKVNITVNTIFYWEIITHDSKENRSKSGIYQFKIK